MVERLSARFREMWARFTPGQESFFASQRALRRRATHKPNYSADERRVVKYLSYLINDQIGAGDDPIGFLIALHAASIAKATTIAIGD